MSAATTSREPEAGPRAFTSRLGRIWRAIIALGAGQGATVIATVVLVPLFLTHWPVLRYGEWLALWSLATYLSTLDMGLNMASTNCLTHAYAKGDSQSYTILQSSSVTFYCAIAGGGSIFLGLAVLLLPISRWLGLRAISVAESRWVILLLGMQVLWSMPVGSLLNIYRTTGDLARTQWLANIRLLMATGLTALMLSAGSDVVLVAASQLVPLLLVASYAWYDISGRLPALRPRAAGVRTQAIAELLRPSLLFAGIMVATALTFQGSVWIISALLGGGAVAIFVTTRTLTSVVRQAVFTLTDALWPELTIMRAHEAYDWLRRVHYRLVVGSTVIGAAAAATLWYEGEEIIRTWTHGKVTVDVSLLHLLLIQVVLQGPWLASSVLPAAFNQHRTLVLSHLGSSLLGGALAYYLMGRIGLIAIPLSYAAAEAVACYYFVTRSACALVRQNYLEFIAKVYLTLGSSAAVAGVVARFVHRVAWGWGLFRWAEVSCATLAACACTAYLVAFGPAERRAIFEGCLRTTVWFRQTTVTES